MKKLMKYFKEEEGLVAIEYVLIAALVALAIITATTALGQKIAAAMTAVVTTLTGAGV